MDGEVGAFDTAKGFGAGCGALNSPGSFPALQRAAMPLKCLDFALGAHCTRSFGRGVYWVPNVAGAAGNAKLRDAAVSGLGAKKA